MFEITDDIKTEAVKAMQVTLLENASKLVVSGNRTEEEVLNAIFDSAVKIVRARFGL